MDEIINIGNKIIELRGQKVILSHDLARLYEVEHRRLNEQVTRNIKKFPADFMFQLNNKELAALRSQFAITKRGKGGSRYPPYAFTEHGAIMAANVLNSDKAVEISVLIVRAFVKMRVMLSETKNLAKRVDELESKYDSQFSDVFTAIKQLILPLHEKKKPKIGFPSAKKN